jgi:hypothetical protein
MALGETKLPKSIVSNPISNNELMYSIFFSVGIKLFQPCIASRGHSMILIFWSLIWEGIRKSQLEIRFSQI